MKRWFLVPLLSTLLLVPVHADDLNARAASVKTQLQTQWLPAWSTKSPANESAVDAAQLVQTLSRAHRLGYSTPQLNLVEAARVHYKLLRDSRRDKTNEGFFAASGGNNAPTKSTLLQAQVVLALVEFARVSGDNEQRPLAIKTWRLLRDRARDRIDGGYYDSFISAPPTPTSATASGDKSAATHLAMLEAGTALFELTRDRSIRTDLLELLDLNAGRFFPERPEEASAAYNNIWEPLSPIARPAEALRTEAGTAIARAQLALGTPVRWIDFVHRTETTNPAPTSEEESARLEALTLLAPLSSSRDERASQIDTTLDTINATSIQPSFKNGVPLLNFAATFGQ